MDSEKAWQERVITGNGSEIRMIPLGTAASLMKRTDSLAGVPFRNTCFMPSVTFTRSLCTCQQLQTFTRY